jgi:hypothetical protein
MNELVLKLHCCQPSIYYSEDIDKTFQKLNLTNPSVRTMALGLTQPPTEMTAKSGSEFWCLENVGSSTSHNSVGPHGHLQG